MAKEETLRHVRRPDSATKAVQALEGTERAAEARRLWFVVEQEVDAPSEETLNAIHLLLQTEYYIRARPAEITVNLGDVWGGRKNLSFIAYHC